MIKFGKWIAKHKVIIVIISMLLLIPSFLGMAATRVNYDILSYLPESLETVEGQDIMVDEFGMYRRSSLLQRFLSRDIHRRVFLSRCLTDLILRSMIRFLRSFIVTAVRAVLKER